MKGSTKKIFGWLLFIGSLSLFYFDFWIGVIVHNLFMCQITYEFHRANLFNTKHSLIKIILPPLIFGLFGFIGSIILFGNDNNTTSSKIQKNTFPKFYNNYGYAKKGINGFFNLQDDIIDTYNLKEIGDEESVFLYLKKLQRGEIELYKLVDFSYDDGNFKFKYDVTQLNHDEHFIQLAKYGFNWVYEIKGLFRISEEYFKSIFETYSEGDETISYEDFYENLIENEIEGEEWNARDMKEYLTINNDYIENSHTLIWDSEPYYYAVSPHYAVFPIEVKQIGYVKACGFTLYYKNLK